MMTRASRSSIAPSRWVTAEANLVRVLVIGLCWGAPLSAEAADAGLSPPHWPEVRDIFVEHCAMCHSAQGAASGLRLDSYEAAIAGSDDGPVMLRRNAEGSELIRRLRGESLPRMPFLSYPLEEEKIQLIVRWIDGGLIE